MFWLKINQPQQMKKDVLGRMLTFERHHVNSLYSRSHYTLALRKLVDEQKIHSEFNDGIKHNVTVLISRYCILKFK